MSSQPNIRRIRIEPYGTNTATENGLIDFYLPNSGYIDLSTLAMFFDISQSGLTSAALSKNAESIIQTLEVFVNGTRVNYISNYNHIFTLLSDYGFTYDEVSKRALFRNELTNGSPSYGAVSGSLGTFCCKKWLGWLDTKEVVDLTKNNVHIRITVAPKLVFAGNTTSFTFTMSNIYMSALYYKQYDAPLKTSFVYDDYKSLFHANANGPHETTLKVIGDDIDYVAAWNLPSNWNVIQSSLYDFKARYLTRHGNFLNSANFKVNGSFLQSYDINRTDAQIAMMDLFPNKFHSMVPYSSVVSGATQYQIVFAAPIKMKFAQPQEVEVVFTCSPINQIYPCVMFVKTNNTLTIN